MFLIRPHCLVWYGMSLIAKFRHVFWWRACGECGSRHHLQILWTLPRNFVGSSSVQSALITSPIEVAQETAGTVGHSPPPWETSSCSLLPPPCLAAAVGKVRKLIFCELFESVWPWTCILYTQELKTGSPQLQTKIHKNVSSLKHLINELCPGQKFIWCQSSSLCSLSVYQV